MQCTDTLLVEPRSDRLSIHAGAFFSCSRYELMVHCWNYLPENRINFREMTARLAEILADPEREQPSTWFFYDASLPVSGSLSLDD